MTLHTERDETRFQTKIFSHSRVNALGAMSQMAIPPSNALMSMLEICLKALEKELGDQVKPRDWSKALVTLTVELPVVVEAEAVGPSDG